ncbi:E3 ubiquitin-protein ligase [Sesbania bispinosa]|nr:E3 ubiquitin-protein ligase [Sesbania bispinosa]
MGIWQRRWTHNSEVDLVLFLGFTMVESRWYWRQWPFGERGSWQLQPPLDNGAQPAHAASALAYVMYVCGGIAFGARRGRSLLTMMVVGEGWLWPLDRWVTRQSRYAERTSDYRGGSISMIITDLDVLDCCICFDPLSVPVFQVGFPSCPSF